MLILKPIIRYPLRPHRVMKKIKYYYNTHTLRYEKLETPFRVKLLRVFGFIASALVTAAIISLLAFRFIGSPNEKLLRAENERMKDRYRELTKETKKIEQQMKELEDRDNEVYRSIFEATPIPDSARLKDIEKEKQITKVEGMEQNDLINSIVTSLNNMNSRINVQKASYKDLGVMVKDKEKLLAATPAIQPVSNADLKRIASGFGYRIDPVYKTVKLHPGLDFAAPAGTLIMQRLMAPLNSPATAAMAMVIMLSLIMAMVTKL